jgi:hypothetical protein
MLNAKNTKKQGDIGLGHAIAYFVSAGYTVSIPLTDSQDYDLIVDNGTLYRVQVKTTKYKSQYGIYLVSLTVKGGNRSYNTIKPFDSTKVDLVFVLTNSGDKYLIPSKGLGSRINLGKKYDTFKV